MAGVILMTGTAMLWGPGGLKGFISEPKPTKKGIRVLLGILGGLEGLESPLQD